MLLSKVFNIYLCLALTLSLISHKTSAQSGVQIGVQSKAQSSESVLSELEFSVKFASLILKTGEKIDRDLAGRSLSDLNDTQIEKIIRTRIEDYLLLIKSETQLTQNQYDLLKKYFSKIKGKSLVEIIKSSQVGLEVFFKKHGIGIAIAMGIGQVFNYALVYASYALGQPQLIPVVQLLPFSWIFAIVPGTYEVIKIRRKLIETLGGKDQYLAYKLQMKKGLEKIKSSKSLIFPMTTNELEGSTKVDVLVIDRLDWKAKYFGRIGLNKGKLNYLSLRNYLKKEKISDPYITKIMNRREIDKDLKTALIATHIFETKNDKAILKFKSTFSNKFIQVKNIPSWDKLEKWSLETLKSMDPLAIRTQMYKIPADAAPEIIFEIWEEILLSHLATIRSVKLSEFRSFKEELQLLKAWSYQQNSPHWNLDHAERFDELLGKSLKLFPEKCPHPEAHAIKLLLN